MNWNQNLRYTAKPVYSCMSQYTSTQHIITNVKHLLKLRNIITQLQHENTKS